MAMMRRVHMPFVLGFTVGHHLCLFASVVAAAAGESGSEGESRQSAQPPVLINDAGRSS